MNAKNSSACLFTFDHADIAVGLQVNTWIIRHLEVGMLTGLESLESPIFFLDPGKGISRLPRIETSNHPTIGLLWVG